MATLPKPVARLNLTGTITRPVEPTLTDQADEFFSVPVERLTSESATSVAGWFPPSMVPLLARLPLIVSVPPCSRYWLLLPIVR